MLRATYADETDSMLVTVGVAVMPGNSAAERRPATLSAGQAHPGVRAVRVPRHPGRRRSATISGSSPGRSARAPT